MVSYQGVQKRVFEIVEVGQDKDYVSKAFDAFIIFLILFNTILVIAGTFPISDEVRSIFIRIEMSCGVVFTIEYLLRIWTAPFLYPEVTSHFQARVKYVTSAMAIIDLLAILPTYMPMFLPSNLRVLRLLRTLRLLRLLKMNRYTNSLQKLFAILRKNRDELFSSMIICLILMTMASVFMYEAEHDVQPTVFKDAFSGFWWAIATLTTIGYGDIYPVTTLGKMLSGVIAILGIGLVAIPTGIISAGFMDYEEEEKENNEEHYQYCPYCGKKIIHK